MKDLAMAVVVRNSAVLIQRRYRRSVGLVHEFPGGSIDEGEQPEFAAIRELNEETGLKVEEVLGTHSYPNELSGQIHFVVVVGKEDQEPQALEPVRQQTFSWLKHSELPLSDFYSADKQFIEVELKKYIE